MTRGCPLGFVTKLTKRFRVSARVFEKKSAHSNPRAHSIINSLKTKKYIPKIHK